MRAGTFIVAGFAATSMAAPFQWTTDNAAAVIQPVWKAYQRLVADGSPTSIIDAMKKVDADNIRNKELLDSFTDGAIDVAAAIQTNSQQIADDVKALGEAVKNSPQLTLEQAIELGKVSTNMTKHIAEGLEALTARKPQFDAMGVSSIVLQQLKGQNAGGNDATAAIQAKLPAEAKNYQAKQPDIVGDALKKAIAAFSVPGPNDAGAAEASADDNTPDR